MLRSIGERAFRDALLLTGFLGVTGASAGAQTADLVGVRAQGLAGAFVAVADDATASVWNPAGFATGGLFSVVWDHRIHEIRPGDDTPGVPPAADGRATFVGVGAPPVGLSYYRIRTRRVRWPVQPAGLEATASAEASAPFELSSLETRQVGVSLLQTIAPGLVVGSTVRVVQGRAVVATGFSRSTDEVLRDAERFDGRSSWTWDLDVGAMLTAGRVQAGLLVRNVREPGFATGTGPVLRADRAARVGLSIRPSDALVVAADLDLTRTGNGLEAHRDLAVGVERWTRTRRLGVRGGLRASLAGEPRAVAAGGVSVALRPSLWLDAQVTGGARDSGRGWGVGGRVGF